MNGLSLCAPSNKAVTERGSSLCNTGAMKRKASTTFIASSHTASGPPRQHACPVHKAMGRWVWARSPPLQRPRGGEEQSPEPAWLGMLQTLGTGHWPRGHLQPGGDTGPRKGDRAQPGPQPCVGSHWAAARLRGSRGLMSSFENTLSFPAKLFAISDANY